MKGDSERGRTYIWGAADNGKRALEFCVKDFDIVGFIDNRSNKLTSFCGYEVISPRELQEKKDAFNVIVAIRYPAQALTYIIENKLNNIHVLIYDGRTEENELIYEAKNYEICVPEYMDKRYAESGEHKKHYLNLNEQQRLLNSEILNLISRYDKETKIIELGCGSGQVANMLFDNGYQFYEGVDFSIEAIRLAKQMNPEHKDDFLCRDVFDYLEKKTFAEDEIILCFEMLEHLNKDREVLEMIPKGHDLIISVPNFSSFNHVRVFENEAEIKYRYDMLKIKEITRIMSETDTNNWWYIVYATR